MATLVIHNATIIGQTEAPVDPDFGRPGGGGPVDPGYGRPGGGGPVDPGYGRPIHHPGHPDHGLPAAPGRPSQPIYHPGHPDHGLPVSGGTPTQPIVGFPDQGLPPGGTPVPPGTINPPLPTPPGALASQIIVAVHRPGKDWEVSTYPVKPTQPLPPTATPKS